MRHDAGLFVKGNADNLVTVGTKRFLVLLQQNTKGPLHFLSRSISPQDDKVNETGQHIFGNQKTRLKSLGRLKLSSLRIERNVCVQNPQLIANDGSVTTETTRTLHLVRTQVIIGVSPESRRNGATTQPAKSKSLSRLLHDIAQTRDATRLINSISDPTHELNQLLFRLLFPPPPPPLPITCFLFL
jgi:hypothetical protein